MGGGGAGVEQIRTAAAEVTAEDEEAGDGDLVRHLVGEVPILDAGGAATLEQDRDTLNRADGGRPVVILVRAWEPPTGDLADFLDDARAHWGPATPILLQPLGGSGLLIRTLSSTVVIATLAILVFALVECLQVNIQ